MAESFGGTRAEADLTALASTSAANSDPISKTRVF